MKTTQAIIEEIRQASKTSLDYSVLVDALPYYDAKKFFKLFKTKYKDVGRREFEEQFLIGSDGEILRLMQSLCNDVLDIVVDFDLQALIARHLCTYSWLLDDELFGVVSQLYNSKSSNYCREIVHEIEAWGERNVYGA